MAESNQMDGIEAQESQQGAFTTEQKRHRMRWLKGVEGFLDLIAKTNMDEIWPTNPSDLAYDLIKRHVMWARTNPDCNLWRFAQPSAEQILVVAWGAIDYRL